MEGEHDLEDAHDRYEKRWMIKENERKAKVCLCVEFRGLVGSKRRGGIRATLSAGVP